MNQFPAGILSKLTALYGAERAPEIAARLQTLIAEMPPRKIAYTISEKDVILITYGDQVQQPDSAPLRVLDSFAREWFSGMLNTLHILPFYPYSSDDGFSVIDYYAVNPALGQWEDIQRLHGSFRLMFDAVFNHISVQSAWFQAFLRGTAPYTDYFITVDPAVDLSRVRRPRTLPLLTPFETAQGTKHVWTTFSADQVDLNASEPEVLLELLRALLFYVRQGADLIRLDAIAYLWKTIGTDCIHLPQTHLIVQLMRDVLDLVAPDVLLITETNVPHQENISYFGKEGSEAQMVYNFSLPPLLLHTFATGNTDALTAWARTLKLDSDRMTFFNFTASHDGIGVTPAAGLLSPAEFAALVARAEVHGGLVSYKQNSDGSRSPYELNITYFDAITDPAVTAQDPQTAVKRFTCSQAIMLALAGVPGVYFHSLVGSRNWRAGVTQTGHNRTINREKLNAADLSAALQTPDSLRSAVHREYRRLLLARTQEPAFHPFAEQKIHSSAPGIFALERISRDGQSRVLALHNVTGAAVELEYPGATPAQDLLSGTTVAGGERLTLQPYQSLWLQSAV